VRGRFRLTPGGPSAHQPWFHIGSLEVTTTWLYVFCGIAGLLTFAVGTGALTQYGALYPPFFYEGRVWSFVTWPFTISSGAEVFWAVLSIFFFWYFGSEIERSMLGKSRMLGMLVLFQVVLGVLLLGISAVTGVDGVLAGINMLQLMVLLLWIAEWPDRMFLFNIPAWLFGLVIVGIQLISYLGNRTWTLLLVFVLGAAINAVVARSFGMLERYAFIPSFRRTQHRPKPAKQKRSRGRSSGPTVVAGPWQEPAAPHVSRDEARMDELLEKIHAHGADSLTSKEKKELLQLRERRRRG